MKSWLRIRKYLHISPKFSTADKNAIKKSKSYIISYVIKPSNIEKHRFSPLLHYKINDHKFIRDSSLILDSQKEGRKYKLKSRPIYYPNHLDAQIFAYYSNKINKKLKIEYDKDSILDQSVIGYRSIPYNKRRSKTTIDFSSEVFEYLKNHKSKYISVLCLDVSSFFDCIDHKILKQNWCHLYGRTHLKKDEYQVFKALTNASYVDIENLLDIHPDFDVKKIKYLNNTTNNSFFDSFEEFRVLAKNNKLIWRYNNKEKKGIPQGTPISAALSNLYFLNVDRKIVEILIEANGLYRRYSDDILIVCETIHINEIKDKISNLIENELNLQLQERKEQLSNLFREKLEDKWRITSYQYIYPSKKPISYLGFEYDGIYTRIRNSSLSKYYRGLKRTIRRGAFYAKSKKINNLISGRKDDDWIYRTSIYRSKSHLGAKRKKIDGVVRWGNYISYVKRSADKYKGINRKLILKQVRNHWKIIQSHISNFENSFGLSKAPKKRRSYLPKIDNEKVS